MPKVSKLLKVSKIKHEKLGEIIELFSPIGSDGNSAYFTVSERRWVDNNDGTQILKNVREGGGIRLTQNTAVKLANALLELVRKGPGKGVTK